MKPRTRPRRRHSGDGTEEGVGRRIQGCKFRSLCRLGGFEVSAVIGANAAGVMRK